MTRWIITILLAVSLCGPADAQSRMPPAQWANEQMPDPDQEAEAKALMESLRCLVCQGQSIADSDAELSQDMRALVRRRLPRRPSRRPPPARRDRPTPPHEELKARERRAN